MKSPFQHGTNNTLGSLDDFFRDCNGTLEWKSLVDEYNSNLTVDSLRRSASAEISLDITKKGLKRALSFNGIV